MAVVELIIRLAFSLFAVLSMSIGIGEHDYVLVVFGMAMFLSGALPKKIPLMNNLLYRVILFGVGFIGSAMVI